MEGDASGQRLDRSVGRKITIGDAPARVQSLRVRVLLLVLIAVLPVALIGAYLGWTDRQAFLALGFETAGTLALDAAATTERLIDQTRDLLGVIATIPAITQGLQPDCDAQLRNVLPNFQEYDNLLIITPAGEIRCSAVPVPAGTASPSSKSSAPRSRPATWSSVPTR
jgi:hypothetical protein